MSETRPCDCCRICKTSFKVKFGNLSGKQFYSSSQNLFKPSQRKDSFGIVLADVSRQVELVFVEDSDRVCNPCGRKILNLGHLFELIKAGTCPTLSNTSIKITNRTLSTPEKASPSWRKAKLVRVNSPEASKSRQMKSPNKSRKSLSFTGANCTTTIPSQKEDEVLRRLNVDDLPPTGLQVKVVYVNPSGNVTVRIPRDDQTKTLVKNLVCENWREVSNAVLKHEELAPEVNSSIRKVLSKEFRDYLKSEPMLCARNPDELAGFSNKLFMEEVRIHCPLWFNCVLGASGLSEEEIKVVGRNLNSLALATAALARVRNLHASAVHYRISTILFHSGVKHDDLNRLNQLGVCMSPDSIARLQSKMNEQLEGKVKIWKASIEENRSAIKLAQEVFRKQAAQPQLDVSQQCLETYEFFSTKGHEYLTKLLDEEKAKASIEAHTADCMETVIRRLESTKLPLYK